MRSTALLDGLLGRALWGFSWTLPAYLLPTASGFDLLAEGANERTE